MDESKLDAALERIANEEPLDEWCELCFAAVRLGKAFAEFDNALKRYVRSNPAPKK